MVMARPFLIGLIRDHYRPWRAPAGQQLGSGFVRTRAAGMAQNHDRDFWASLIGRREDCGGGDPIAERFGLAGDTRVLLVALIYKLVWVNCLVRYACCQRGALVALGRGFLRNIGSARGPAHYGL